MNKVVLAGIIGAVNGNTVTLIVSRNSGTEDRIIVKRVNIAVNLNDCVTVRGAFKHHQKEYFVIADSIEKLNYTDNYNDVFLEGVIAYTPTYRITPNRREITDVVLSVESDYLPCIFWGNMARFVNGLKVGDSIRVGGRLQSRIYKECMTAYEVSVSLVEVIGVL